jgi:hypothetical protein
MSVSTKEYLVTLLATPSMTARFSPCQDAESMVTTKDKGDGSPWMKYCISMLHPRRMYLILDTPSLVQSRKGLKVGSRDSSVWWQHAIGEN